MALAGFVGLPLLAAVAAAATGGGLGCAWYLSVAHPPLSLPCALFPPVWAAAALPTGFSAWLVWRARLAIASWPLPRTRARPRRRPFARGLRPLQLWGWQVLMGVAWMPLLFVGHAPAWALLAGVLPALLLLAASVAAFRQQSAAAAMLLLPSVALMCYAGYLTTGIWWLAALR